MVAEAEQFSSVEQLEGAARAETWNIDYRQLRRGSFAAQWASCQQDALHITLEQFNNHIQVACEPPQGFFGIFLVQPGTGAATALGHELIDGDLIVFPPDSEMEFVTREAVQNYTLFLPEDDFLSAARALAPAARLYSPQSASIHGGDVGGIAAVQRDIAAACSTGSLNTETASNLLARTILRIADVSSQPDTERLKASAASAVARRAQGYIEEHLTETIRLRDLCLDTGVGLRTLQRCFAAQFQISPTDYIKAQRLNAVRRELVAIDPIHCRVTDVALRNGLSHLGRFSADYKRFFGELPSVTLSARRSSVLRPVA